VAPYARNWVFQPNGESQLSHADRRRGEGRAGACTARELARHGGQAGADETDPRPRRTEGERPNDREAAGDIGACREQAQYQRHAESEDDRRPQQRAGRRRRPPDQLGLPAFFIPSRVPPHHEQQHDRDERGVEHRHLRHRQLARAVHIEDRSVERYQPGTGVDRLGRFQPLGGGRVEGLRRGGRCITDQEQHGVPDRHDHPIAAQRQPDEQTLTDRLGLRGRRRRHRRTPCGSVR
jgi:hypothetical protein